MGCDYDPAEDAEGVVEPMQAVEMFSEPEPDPTTLDDRALCPHTR